LANLGAAKFLELPLLFNFIRFFNIFNYISTQFIIY